MAYSQVSDMLLGNMPLPSEEKGKKYVDDAADEIDSKLGFRYVTPIVVAADPNFRATTLTLKRISNWLASGRLVLAMTSPSENQVLNAYGAQLVKEATKALDALANGEMTLPGAQFLDSTDVGQSGPVVSNLDAESNVEAFYNLAQQPPWAFPPTSSIWPAGAPINIPYTW